MRLEWWHKFNYTHVAYFLMLAGYFSAEPIIFATHKSQVDGVFWIPAQINVSKIKVLIPSTIGRLLTHYR
jgi:hypothetical protein